MIDWKLADKVIDLLNGMLNLDRGAVAAMIANRVPCNEDLADHPTMQASKQPGGYHVGMLGVMNGLCGVDEGGWGGVAAVFDDDPSSTGRKLVRFERAPTVEERIGVANDG